MKTNPCQRVETDSEHPAVVFRLPSEWSVVEVFTKLAQLEHCVFFDSASADREACRNEADEQEQLHRSLARYSFIAADPFQTLCVAADRSPGFDQLMKLIEQFNTPTLPGLPPFQGGAAGILSYELGHSLERAPFAEWNEFQTPALSFGLYDVVVAFDHLENSAWLISQGFPESTHEGRHERAMQRAVEVIEYLDQPVQPTEARSKLDPVAFTSLAPQYKTPFDEVTTSDFQRDNYLDAVNRAIDYLYEGDIFQVNLSQRLLRPWQGSRQAGIESYLSLRQRNPAPFGGYCDLGDWQVWSTSPERFLSVQHDAENAFHSVNKPPQVVETRPIKGTRPRGTTVIEDGKLAATLQGHPKDRAENVMIVDLLRNDLSRVCTSESVKVSQLCGLESYQHVHHLVSVVNGQLSNSQTPIDLLKASFPGGSITGAPKIRAMEIIAELEPTVRGPYCGSLAYLGFDGAMDSSILIRTVIAGRGWVQASVGGGIVVDSDPATEYDETWQKAAGLLGPLPL